MLFKKLIKIIINTVKIIIIQLLFKIYIIYIIEI